MRVKESAADYRFFREPDLLPLRISADTIDSIKSSLPLSPISLRKKLNECFGLAEDIIEIIVSRPAMSDYFLRAVEHTSFAQTVANLMVTEFLGEQAADEFCPPVSAKQLSEVAELFGTGEINSSTVKKLLSMLKNTDLSASELVAQKDMRQINDRDQIRYELDRVLHDTPKLLIDYQNGKLAAKKAIIGKVMAATGGRANPIALNEIFDSLVSN